jgi:outer membrane protein OmpA-like peptidoglycan-associated protein
MKKTKRSLLCIVCIAVVCGAQSEESPWDPQSDTGKQPTEQNTDKNAPAGDTKPAALADRLAALTAELDKNHSALKASGAMYESDLYSMARARIALAEPVITKKPKSEKAREAFAACSLLSHAAVAQMKAIANSARIDSLHGVNEKVLTELNATHEKINSIEKSHASRLKEQLEAERQRAEALQEEAERKFKGLQSELINVKQDARGTIISMSDILFDVGKATLTTDLKTNLAKIAGILMVYKEPKIIIEGHTDNTGSEEFNQRLSEHRAQNVLEYLIEQGVEPSRLRSVGYAFHRPIASNDTKEGRQKNRRVDLVIQDKRVR